MPLWTRHKMQLIIQKSCYFTHYKVVLWSGPSSCILFCCCCFCFKILFEFKNRFFSSVCIVIEFNESILNLILYYLMRSVTIKNFFVDFFNPQMSTDLINIQFRFSWKCSTLSFFLQCDVCFVTSNFTIFTMHYKC